ncbi:hypothetical protein MINTM008_45380 [Mycobacterium intracellulare]|uniref:Uncharacterized protein n=1 Tax=Mycobacterium intracellulare TaxID=1767 RepID=A0A7R7RQV5_MYCIT|nr:hypothetical protein MINTM002_42670 [Mycobacterium intracellulare]BCO59112.1 hypothetical protein MINTM005_43560 [Mycobacterium intracellulare]BCO64374.1 hypothetical protein MINTM006_43240 [Mycobacterium intracellulare]BCO69684.1 hypothetical protein MINTM007_42950 [Mycobacterium intracellulare]BCO75203.1 hypothetical protein MINTM008_45380 [Mycobacterium intracellulare]
MPGAVAAGRLAWFSVDGVGVAAEKITPENTISHTGTERIKQPLTLLDGCQRAGVYFEHTFERPVKEARS